MKGFIAALVAIVTLTIGTAALASHVTQADPAAVPVGFLAAHNSIADVPVGPIKRAVKRDGADFFVQHVHLNPATPTAWHTHPGPAFVMVVKGTLTYEDACTRVTYGAGQGFVDRGFGHVHRAIAGPQQGGVDFYVVYVLPAGSQTHVLPADQPAGCKESSDESDED